MVYCFRDNSLLIVKNADKADPEVIGIELEKITDANSGKLTKKAVVEAATSPRNPLHKHFEWDDAKAAHSHRLHQAGEIIRYVMVVDDDAPDGVVPSYVSIHEDKGGRAYRHVKEIKDNKDLQHLALGEMIREIEAFQRRYKNFLNSSICADLDRIKKKISKRRRDYESRAGA